MKNRLTAGAKLLITDQPYLLDFTPGDFLLFPTVKGQLAGLSFAQESLKKTWGGVSRNITAETFAAAFCRWFEWREKCVHIGGDHAEKILEIKLAL